MLVVPVALAAPITGALGAPTTCTSADPAEKSPVFLSPVRRFFFTAATLKEYEPPDSPVAVHWVDVEDFVSAREHPVPATAHGPVTDEAICTSYPTSLFSGFTTTESTHDTPICPPPLSVAEIFGAASSVDPADAVALSPVLSASPLTTGPLPSAARPPHADRTITAPTSNTAIPTRNTTLPPVLPSPAL